MYLITLLSTIIIDAIWLVLSRSIIYEKTFDNMGATLSKLFIIMQKHFSMMSDEQIGLYNNNNLFI